MRAGQAGMLLLLSGVAAAGGAGGHVGPAPQHHDRAFMRAALAEARAALALGEVPVGCVLVRDGRIMARCVRARERAESERGRKRARGKPMEHGAPRGVRVPDACVQGAQSREHVHGRDPPC